MAVTHIGAISIAITLAAAPATTQAYRVLVLVDEGGGSGLGGDRTRSYSTPTEIDTDVTAGDLSSAAGNQLKAALAQRPRADLVYVGRVDTAGGETYADGLTEAIADLGATAFYIVTADTRTDSEQSTLATSIESSRYLYLTQSSDADWITAGLPAAYSWYEGKERTAIIYHDDDTVYDDTAWAAKALAVDPDERATPFTLPLKGVSALSSGLSSGDRVALLGNEANVALPLGGESYFVLDGQNGAGRPLHEILTADWLQQRLELAIGTAWAGFGSRNEKWPVTVRGAGTLKEVVDGVLQAGVNAGHFEPDNIEFTAPAPTTADANSGTLRGSGRAQVGNTVIEFSITADLSRTPLASA